MRLGDYIEDYKRRDGNKDRNSDLKILLGVLGDIEVEDITPVAMRAAVEKLLKGREPSTLNRYLSTWSVFFRDLEERAPSFIYPLRGIKRFGLPKRPPDTFPIEWVPELVRAAYQIGQSQHRRVGNKLFVTLGLETGMRAQEICAICLKSLDLKNGRLLGVKTKGSKYRDFYLMPETMKLVKAYLKLRAETLLPIDPAGEGPQYPLIVVMRCGKKGQPETFRMSEKTAWTIVHQVGEHLGVTDGHPHRLRHTFANWFLSMTGKDVRLLKEQLGHSNINTTMRYLEVTEEELRRGQRVFEEATREVWRSAHRDRWEDVPLEGGERKVR